jgi:hypothetical protein
MVPEKYDIHGAPLEDKKGGGIGPPPNLTGKTLAP